MRMMMRKEVQLAGASAKSLKFNNRTKPAPFSSPICSCSRALVTAAHPSAELMLRYYGNKGSDVTGARRFIA